ncbi:unnamed protein product [Spirodela intermedia]|uniref:Carboxypeptidase n=1 Tax=Spirodela intermedia TaxID=51605 RepID=A0A7I8JFH7_SPIIN|nr:unnamed protein product [Spirodela intermedia]CAA6668904.1 unnamed protein product [Spirodela intermedia]
MAGGRPPRPGVPPSGQSSGAAPSPAPISQYSGFITVDRESGRALFYWFFVAQTLPSRRPLLLWLNGGPGCSSVGYGAAVELGPLRVKRDGNGLEFNRYAWNQEANLLFLESPVGVGFSYTNTSSDLNKLNDELVAEDAYEFLVNWYERFPQYKSHDFYISGESYAGHYVPQLAELIYDRNEDSSGKFPRINLRGFINWVLIYGPSPGRKPRNGRLLRFQGLLEFAWSHTVISDELFRLASRVCDFRHYRWPSECSVAMDRVFRQYREIDIYNIYAPKCTLMPSSPTTRMGAGGYDPCFSAYAEEYFNRAEVRRSLHADAIAGDNRRWKVCSDSILRNYNYTVLSVTHIYLKLISAGMRIWVYSGDADGRVPVIGTRYWVESLGLPLRAQWRPWYHRGQVGGRFAEYEGLTVATVRGAGHLVPLNKPRESLVVINSYLSGLQLPIRR